MLVFILASHAGYGLAVNNLPAIRESGVRSLGWEDALEEGTATHSSILAWKILWTGEPGGLHRGITINTAIPR